MADVRSHTPASERGFTLIETMIAMALVGFGLLVIVQLQGIGSRGLKRTVESSVAMNLATNTLEELMVMTYDDQILSYAELRDSSKNTYFNLFGYRASSAAVGKFTVRWSAEQNDFYSDVAVEVFWNNHPPAPATSAEADHSIRQFTTQVLNPERATRR
jgi:prepilin-type N-terminal cleavage/methylation domain-containing protein